MKITQVMLAKRFGGAERLFVDLVSALVNMGNDVLAICQPGSETEQVLKGVSGIKLNTVKTFSTRDPFAWRAIATKIQQHDSDIVQSHLSRGTYMAGKACKQLKKPLVVTLHNYIDLKYYKNVTKFIPATKDQVEYLGQKGIPESRIELIPHFSHLDPVTEASFCENETLVYACYGRMVHKKGFHVVLNAFKKLTETNIKVTLLIGGDGPESENLKHLCKELGLAENVKFVGWIKDVETFLKSVDVFVLPSLDEPFGIAVLEAMAMGKPIISTKSQGPREILNKKNAYLAEVNNIESLFEAMILAAKDSTDREKKAGQALSDYKEFYAKEVVVPKFLKLYEQVVADQKNNS
ncbi:MAG: glycosyltransferase involved in cell wall biosynthesis [Gammaproteobacteria bacterium]|jgi:glycosyltransferase involved in cell wall biosynthesis